VTESLKPAAEELRVNMAAVPKLLETVARIGSAQIEMMKARAEEKPNPFGRPNGPLPPRDPASLNLEYDVSTIMRQKGVSREEALSQLNQANNQSVWEGNTMFQGWGD
jgi:NACalpha-BTF3-like transcription factor